MCQALWLSMLITMGIVNRAHHIFLWKVLRARPRWIGVDQMRCQRMIMIIIKSPAFTWMIATILGGEDYRALQNALVKDRAIGVVIPGGGGLRKARWVMAGRGREVGCAWSILVDEQGPLIFAVCLPEERPDGPEPVSDTALGGSYGRGVAKWMGRALTNR